MALSALSTIAVLALSKIGIKLAEKQKWLPKFFYHRLSMESAGNNAREAGVDDRVRFEVLDAGDTPPCGYDLVTSFDCLHDMGDPAGAARAIRSALKPDGTWMIV